MSGSCSHVADGRGRVARPCSACQRRRPWRVDRDHDCCGLATTLASVIGFHVFTVRLWPCLRSVQRAITHDMKTLDPECPGRRVHKWYCLVRFCLRFYPKKRSIKSGSFVAGGVSDRSDPHGYGSEVVFEWFRVGCRR